jgi:hypothetical protein
MSIVHNVGNPLRRFTGFICELNLRHTDSVEAFL